MFEQAILSDDGYSPKRQKSMMLTKSHVIKENDLGMTDMSGDSDAMLSDEAKIMSARSMNRFGNMK